LSSYLDAEYKQFLSNVRLAPADKAKNTTPFFEKIGNIEVSILFTPSQVCYNDDPASGGKKIVINGGNEISSPSDSLKASSHSVLYMPKYEETALHSSLNFQINSGLPRYVYTTDSAMFPLIYSEVPFNMNFSFMAFTRSDIKPGEKPLRTDYDHCIFFSVPLGDSAAPGEKDYLNICHGIVLILKGEISGITGFLEAKGFDFENPPPISNKLYLTADANANPVSISLDWILDGEFKIEYRRRIKNPETSPDEWYDPHWITITDSHTGINYTHAGQMRGFHYYYRITEKTRGGVAPADLVIAKDPDTTTVRNENDGTLAGNLAFTELALLGSVEERVNSYGTVQKITRPDTWIEIKNTSNRIVRLDKVNFLYTDTDPPSESPSDIIFGPECLNSGIDYLPVKEYIYPGEYHIISKSLDYIFSEMYIYNISRRNFPVRPVTNNTLKMKIGTIIIDQVITDGDNGGFISSKANHSRVYGDHLGVFMWINSQNSFVNINPNSAYAGFNNCTPGMRELRDEY
jgi:hypothetical protein